MTLPYSSVGKRLPRYDALEFIIAGASAIQIGSYNLVDPSSLVKTIEGIKAYMLRKKINRFRYLIKSLAVS